MTKVRITRYPHLANNNISLKFSTELEDLKNSFSNKKRRKSFIELEQRVEALEDQNSHLLNFIHFFYESFPELVRNILTSDLTSAEEMTKETDRSEAIEEVGHLDLSAKNQPLPTRREMEVIDLLIKGLCAKEIAKSLFISETTVITHKKDLKRKFNVRNTTELIAKALTLHRAKIFSLLSSILYFSRLTLSFD